MSFLALPDEIIRKVLNIGNNPIESVLPIYLSCKTLQRYCDRDLTYEDFDLAYYDVLYRPLKFFHIHKTYLDLQFCQIVTIKTLIVWNYIRNTMCIKYKYYKPCIRNVMKYLSRISDNPQYIQYLTKISEHDSWRVTIEYNDHCAILKFVTRDIHISVSPTLWYTEIAIDRKNLIVLMNMATYYDDCYIIGKDGCEYGDHPIMIGLEYADDQKLHKFLGKFIKK